MLCARLLLHLQKFNLTTRGSLPAEQCHILSSNYVSVELQWGHLSHLQVPNSNLTLWPLQLVVSWVTKWGGQQSHLQTPNSNLTLWPLQHILGLNSKHDIIHAPHMPPTLDVWYPLVTPPGFNAENLQLPQLIVCVYIQQNGGACHCTLWWLDAQLYPHTRISVYNFSFINSVFNSWHWYPEQDCSTITVLSR